MKTSPYQVQTDRSHKTPPRAYHLLWLIFVLFSILIARLWSLQIAQGEELAARAEVVRTRLLRVQPPRGAIVDRNGIELAKNRAKFVVTVMPDSIRKQPQRIAWLAEQLEMPESELKDAIFSKQINPYVPLIVASGISMKQATILMENRHIMSDIDVNLQPSRVYPYGKLFAHLIGYVGQISQEELKTYTQIDPQEESLISFSEEGMPPIALYDGSDQVGKNGIERQYQHWLHGVPGGERVIVTPLGKRVGTLEEIEPTAGAKLTLTIDKRLQQTAHDLLKGRLGALVAIDPRNGEVLASVSQPTFDANLFVGRIPAKLWNQLMADPRYPLNNRAIQSAYAPGSIFKPLVALGGLREGVISTQTGTHCGGGLQIGRRYFRCWTRHGSVNFYSSLSQSCDVFYYQTAQKLGPDRLAAISREFGLGARTGIDLPHERSGLVPDIAWKQKSYNQPWYGGETFNFGIGQGYLLTTPLQMAVATAAIANKGHVYRPHLLRKAVDQQGKTLYQVKRETLHDIQAPTAYWDAVIEGMVRTVESGTAKGSRVPGVRVAGKTGSAEFRKGGKTHSWYVAFAPADNPRVAICVMAEEAGHGGEVAVPIAQKWLQAFFDLEKPKVETARK